MGTENSEREPYTLSQALRQKLRELLARKGWSQRAFAKKLGLVQGTVSYFLGGQRRSNALDFYEQLARVFDMPLSQLIADLEARVAVANRTRPRPPLASSSEVLPPSVMSDPGGVAHAAFAPIRPPDLPTAADWAVVFEAEGLDPLAIEACAQQLIDYVDRLVRTYQRLKGTPAPAKLAAKPAKPARRPRAGRRSTRAAGTPGGRRVS